MSKKYEQVNEKVKAAAATASPVIAQPRTLMVALEVEGTAPLIMHNFGQKSMEQMLRKHMGLSVQREPKVPRQCIEDAMIRNTEGAICIPPVGFKRSMELPSTANKVFKSKPLFRTSIYIQGGSIPITYEEMIPRVDMVRVHGAPDVRFRPQFNGWKARMVVDFSEIVNVQTIVDLLQRGGKGGMGEWRPEKMGSFGTYRVGRHISDPDEIAEVLRICAPAVKPLVIPDWAMDAEIARTAPGHHAREGED